jgi:hypothetical protein
MHREAEKQMKEVSVHSYLYHTRSVHRLLRQKSRWLHKSRSVFFFSFSSFLMFHPGFAPGIWRLRQINNFKSRYCFLPSLYGYTQPLLSLQQMRLIHKVPFTLQEIELYRQLIFNNLTHGMKYVLDAMEDMELKVSEDNLPHIDLIENACDIRDGDSFPRHFYQPLKSLWADPNVQQACSRGNEAALPEKCALFPFSFNPPDLLTPLG